MPVSVIRAPPERLAASAMPKSATSARPSCSRTFSGLDVAVDDVVPVRVVQRARHFGGDAHRVRDRELLLPVEPVAQGLALDERHDVEQEAVRSPRVEEREDVRVLEIGGGLDLGEEPLGADDRGQLRVEDFDGDLAVVLQVLREVHGGHAALTQLPLDPIAVGEGGGQARVRVAGGCHWAPICPRREAAASTKRGQGRGLRQCPLSNESRPWYTLQPSPPALPDPRMKRHAFLAVLMTIVPASVAPGQTPAGGPPSAQACGVSETPRFDSLALMLLLRPRLVVDSMTLDRTRRDARALADAFVPPKKLSFREPPVATAGMASLWSDGTALALGLVATLELRTDTLGHLSSLEIVDSTGAPELNQALLAAAQRADSLGIFARSEPGDTTSAHIILTAILPFGRPETAVMLLRVPVILPTGEVAIKHMSRPEYPAVPKQVGLPGLVELQWVVDERGKAIPKSIIAAHAQFKEFLAAAVHVVLGATFGPAHWGTCPIKEVVKQTISFVGYRKQ